MKHIFLILLGIMIFASIFWYNMAIWGECRESNSIMYCLRIINR